MPTTFVRRLISAFTRSRGFVDHSLGQCAIGKVENATRSSFASIRSCATPGRVKLSVSATTSSCWATWSAPGWAKIVRIAAATIWVFAFGTPESALGKEVHPAALPGGLDEDLPDRLFQSEVLIGDDEPDARESPLAKPPEERRPKGAVLGVAHVAAGPLP